MNKADRIVQHIVELQYRLCQVENNLQYIKVTQALKRSLEKFYDLLKNDQKLMSQYQSTYIGWFYTGLGTLFMTEYATLLLNIGMAEGLSIMFTNIRSECCADNQ